MSLKKKIKIKLAEQVGKLAADILDGQIDLAVKESVKEKDQKESYKNNGGK